MVWASASASADGTGGASRSADICHSCRSPPSACCGSRLRLRYTLMNVVVRIRLSQARRLVPGRNWWKAAYALTDVSWTRSSASVGFLVIRSAAGYNWLSWGTTSRSNRARLSSSSSIVLIPGSGG